MSLSKNPPLLKAPANFRAEVPVLCAAALLSFAVGYICPEEPLRTTMFFVSGILAGAAAVLAWMQFKAGKKAGDMASNRTISDTALSWTDIAAAMPDPAIVLDRAAGILNYNAAARSIFERLRLGLPLEHLNRDPEFISAVADVFETGEKRTARLRSHGGGQRFIATVTPLGSSERRPVMAVLITIHDESEQHRLLEMRADFIANASHELRTPLASVRGFIETLQGPARHDEAARSRFLTIMAEQAERMTRLIDDLLLLSRVEEKANLKPTGKVNLQELIDDVVRSITSAAKERHIEISVVHTSPPIIAMGDRDELFQVFHNIIENAVKYGRDNGSVKIKLMKGKTGDGENTPGRAAVSITDDGPGIAPEHLPRLTERFYRVNAEHSRRVGGTGLGLAIVKHVLNRHDGELTVESVVGHGTTFRVILPIQK
jgi:two-component system phosphate regulon sensor histidine kinase PhoR